MAGSNTATREHLATLKDVGVLYLEMGRRLFRHPWRWKEILQSVVTMGIGSLPIITIATAFAGLVVTAEIAWHMDKTLHTVSMIPGVTGQFILRELGIAIPALLLVAKVGASATAEVGTMKVTEQIDALKLLKIDPIDYLVFPRFIASIISITCLIFFSIAVTLACAILISVTRFNFHVFEFILSLRPYVYMKDLGGALAKGVVFGSIIPLVSCAYGFRCKGGAEGVGTATTNSVVTATILIILMDFVLTWVFTSLI
jgi:phospholipid/cholesterol/gamma-HCH transport system permease protein